MRIFPLINLRTGSRWVEDPEFVARRQARAFQLVEYADVHNWIEGPSFLSNLADDVEVEDASDDNLADQDEDEGDSDTSGDSSASSDGDGDARSSSKGTGHSQAQASISQQPRTSPEATTTPIEGEVNSDEAPSTSARPSYGDVPAPETKVIPPSFETTIPYAPSHGAAP